MTYLAFWQGTSFHITDVYESVRSVRPTRTHHKYVWLGSGRPRTEPYIPLVLADQFGRPIPRSEVQILHFRSRHWPAELVGCLWNPFHKHDWIVTKRSNHACGKHSTSIQPIRPASAVNGSAGFALPIAVLASQIGRPIPKVCMARFGVDPNRAIHTYDLYESVRNAPNRLVHISYVK